MAIARRILFSMHQVSYATVCGLVASDPDLVRSCRGVHGDTLLMLAIECNRVDIFLALHALFVDNNGRLPRTVNSSGRTYVTEAAFRHSECFSLMLCGTVCVDLEETDDLGNRAIHYVCRHNRSVLLPEAMQRCDWTQRTRDGMTVFHLCLSSFSGDNIMLLLTDKRTWPLANVANSKGYTPLYQALIRSSNHIPHVVHRLLDVPGVDVNSRPFRYMPTILRRALIMGNTDAVTQLIKLGVDANAVDESVRPDVALCTR
jgi:ankyrin repeat protein